MHGEKGNHPRISAVVCTAGERASLDDCLRSLRKLNGSDHEVLLVENREDSVLCAHEFRSWGGRLIHEPHGGLDTARNRGAAEALGDIVAFTDDDCEADSDWVAAIARAFEDPTIDFAVGRVRPHSLDRRSERCFEGWFSFDRGHLPRRFHLDSPSWRDVVPGYLGTGCNMAFRREVLEEIGGFDDALDMGTLVHGGGDIDMFSRLLEAGYTASYVPDAVIHHHHRQTMGAVTRQFLGYGASQGALAYKIARQRPRQRASAIVFWVARMRRIGLAAARRLRYPKDPPWWLLGTELVGLIIGPALYPLSERRTRRALRAHDRTSSARSDPHTPRRAPPRVR